MTNRYGYVIGDHLTYFPSKEHVDDNRHWECVIEDFTPSGRYARIKFATLADGTVTRSVPLSRLKRQALIEV